MRAMDGHGEGLALLSVIGVDGRADPRSDPRLSPETVVRAYREMRRLRLLDERMTLLQRQGRIGFHGGATGQEAVPVAAGLALRQDDWVFPALREHGVMLVRGFPIRTLIAQAYGRRGDVLKGRQMPSHASGRAVHQVSWSSCIGTQIPHAVGAAWAMRARKTGAVTVGFMGDGATSTGDFHAAMNFAGVWKVPCVLVCQNNHFSLSVPTARQTASPGIASKAQAYGIPGVRVDGNDLLALMAAFGDAIHRARTGKGPTFIEAVTYRMGPHSTSDDPSRYRSQAEVDAWAKKDPLGRLRLHMGSLGLLTGGFDATLDREIEAEIKRAIDEVEAMPEVDPDSLFDDVYAEIPCHLHEQRGELKKNRTTPTHR